MLGRVVAEVESTSDLDTLAGRLKGSSSIDEGVVDAILENWRALLWVFGFVIVGGVGFQWYREGRERDIGEASHRFQQAQELFVKLYGSVGAGTDPAKELRAFEDTLAWLKESHSRTAYAQLGELYMAMAELQKGKPENALVKLESLLPADALTRLDGKLTRESFLEEFALFLKARALVASGSAEGEKLLYELLERGAFVNVEALVMLFSTARDAARRHELEEAARKLVARRPEFRKLMSTALTPYGVALPGAELSVVSE